MVVAYAHSLGPVGGTVLDFTDWDKWIVEPVIRFSIHRNMSWVSGNNTRNLQYWNDEGDTRSLRVTMFGDLDTIRASAAEIEAMLVAAFNAATPENALPPVEYIEQLNESTPQTWWCKGGVFTPDYTNLGGNSMSGDLVLELVKE